MYMIPARGPQTKFRNLTISRLTMGNHERQATGSWAKQSRYLGLGTWADDGKSLETGYWQLG